MIVPPFLKDISAYPTTDAVQRACEAFDAWCHEQRLEGMAPSHLAQDLTRLQSGSRPEERIWDVVPHRMMRLCEEHGREELDRWWLQHGKARFWDEATQQPKPEVANVLFFALEYVDPLKQLVQWALDKGWSPDVANMTHNRLTPLHVLIRLISQARLEDPSEYDVKPELYNTLFDRLLTPLTLNSGTMDGTTPLSFLIRGLYTYDAWFKKKNYQHLLALGKRLVDAGADVSLPDSQGYTPLQILVRHWSTFQDMPYACDFLHLLLEAGADPCVGIGSASMKKNISLLDFLDQLPPQESLLAFRTHLQRALCQKEATCIETSLREKKGKGPALLATRTRGRL